MPFVLFFADMSFQCLGSWAGENGETYMSLLDTKLPQLGEEPRPRYRCAVSIILRFPFYLLTLAKSAILANLMINYNYRIL